MAGLEGAVEGLSACECPVCFLFLSDRDRLPMSMPCGHTLCKVCVDQLAGQSTSTASALGQKSRPTFPCPLCRQWINIDSVSLNVTLRDLLYELKRIEVKHAMPVGTSLNVNYNDIAFGDPLDRGAFGEVYRARWRGDDVAVKVLASGQLTPELMQSFQREVFVMNCLRHPNIVLLMGACQTPPRLAIVMEFVAGGSLHKVLHIDKVRLSPAHIGQVGIDVCRGLQYLHSINILHRDLKSKNVLLTGDVPCQAKLCDFGLSRMRQESATMTGNIGTVHWTAPEILNNSRYQFPADIYSFGMVLYEMVCGHIPFPNMIPMAVMLAVVVNKQQPALPDNAHPILADLIRKCIQWNPDDRPSISDVLSTLVELLPSSQPTTREPGRRPVLHHQDSLGVVFVPVSDTAELVQQDSQLQQVLKALHNAPQDNWDYEHHHGDHHGDQSDFELAQQLEVEAKSYQLESDFKLAEQLQMRENTFLAPKDETPSPVVPPQPLLDSIKSGNVPHLKQVSKKKSFLPAKKSATKSSLPEKVQPQAKPFGSSLAKRQPSEPLTKSRVPLVNKSAPAPSVQVNSLSKKAPVKSAPSVVRSVVNKKSKKAPAAKTQDNVKGPPPPPPPPPPGLRRNPWHTPRQLMLAQVRRRAPTVAKQLKPVQTVEKRAFRIGRVVDGYDPEQAQYTLQNEIATFSKGRLRHVEMEEPLPAFPVGRVVSSSPRGKVKRVSSMIDQQMQAAIMPPRPPPPPRMKLHPSIKSAIEHFKVSELHHVTTEIKNILPDSEMIAMERTEIEEFRRSLHPVIRTEIEEFRRSDLQLVETAVKIHLPSAEIIAQEKQQQQQQQRQQQGQQQQGQEGSSVDQFEDAESSSSEHDIPIHSRYRPTSAESSIRSQQLNNVPEGRRYVRNSSLGVEQDIGDTLRPRSNQYCTVS